MGHVHNHNHSHNHSHSFDGNVNRAFAAGIILNSVYIIVEALYGILSHSMALLADAGHNLSDVLGLVLAWGASYLLTKHPTRFRTYGFRKSTILAALLNAILLLIAIGGIGLEAVERFFNPEPVNGVTVIMVSAIGVVINGLTAFLFVKGKEHDLNIKGAFLHMAADAAVSLGVVFAGIIILNFNIYWIDPLISIVIMLVILFGTWNLLKDSFNLAMDSVPNNVDITGVENYLKSVPGVMEFHDLHIWAMSTTSNALTVHLVTKNRYIDDGLTKKISGDLNLKYGIEHTTIQFEAGEREMNCCPDCIKS